MKRAELYQKVRRAVMIDGMSRCGAAAYFGINRKAVDKMLIFPEPPQHGRSGRTYSGKLAEFTGIIDRILTEDRTVHAKQRHTGVGIFERLRDEHGFTGGITIVREYVTSARRRRRDVFIPLSHKLGHAVDADRTADQGMESAPIRAATWACCPRPAPPQAGEHQHD
ncbi:hypothetical protein NT2_12_01320 [Caenibius tardaugens NBRC 16725]|uniref:Transposase n=1 Tax=Caenibius tardaugens NBRC 16725 TaxID=1219035 RepID=U3A801_9SPHN|nr:hypothetical protein [Caenibius tardaugens]GAD50873.1 hypothetical protein NT2_12_01320 [Caenibius tardaugens NBRC 16725]